MWLLLPSLLISPSFADTPTALDLAAHRGVWNGAQIEWVTTVQLPDVHGGMLDLAVPLPAEVDVLGRAVEPIRDVAGRLIALELEPGRLRHTFRVTQPMPDPPADRLWPPLLDGESVQRITLEGLQFFPDPNLGIEKHLRHTSQAGISRQQRRQLDRIIDKSRARARDQPIYLIADARLQEAGGLVGQLQADGKVDRKVSVSVGLVFAFLVSSLLLVQRWLVRRSREEAISRYMDQEFIWPMVPPPQPGAAPAGADVPPDDSPGPAQPGLASGAVKTPQPPC